MSILARAIIHRAIIRLAGFSLSQAGPGQCTLGWDIEAKSGTECYKLLHILQFNLASVIMP